MSKKRIKILSAYNKKLLLNLFLAFLLFLGIILITEYYHEKKYRTDALNKELDGYSKLYNNYIITHSLFENQLFGELDSLQIVLPDTNLRITIIDLSGKVLYDSRYKNSFQMENHFSRPEVKMAESEGVGTDIRTSSTLGTKYYYFAKRYSKYYIRISLLYNIDAKHIIEPDKVSFITIIVLFLFSSLALLYITNKFSKSLASLRKFTQQALANKPIDDKIEFPENELGNIGQNIINIYQKLNKAKQELSYEKEKLIRHMNLIEEGIAIFTRDKNVIATNSQFIRYINIISEQTVYSSGDFFLIDDFSPLFTFIDKHTDELIKEKISQPTYEISVSKNKKFFTVKCIVFQDKTFEVIIMDTTRPAKRKLLKQQITDNIAHELKTPVSSIMGFLETIINTDLDISRQTYFIQKAYAQTCRLADLIEDIALLTKIEEAGNLYKLENINLNETISNVIDDVHLKLIECNIQVEVNISETIHFHGNPVLLYSVFRNLFDNVINYAGPGIRIEIEKYSEDEENFYFSFSDTGVGVPEKDLPRLFERFYRVDKSRDRKSGGTGLGLAIVKNAIEFHKGEISVKNRKEGGLKFLFSINRKLQEM